MTTRPIPPELAPGEQPFELEDLDAALEEYQDADEHDPEVLARMFPSTAPVYRWFVADDGAAEWAMRMVAAIEAEGNAIQKQYALWIEPIVAWRDEQLRRIDPRRRFFASHLEAYALRVRAADPKRATIALPSGKVATRAPKAPTVQVADEEEVLKWAAESLPAEEYDAIVKITTKLLISEIRSRAAVDERPPPPEWEGNIPEDYEPEYRVVWKSSGEVVPGLVAEVGSTTATVTPAL